MTVKARHDELASPILVVGVGNRSRGDDGVGPRVVDALASMAPGEFRTIVVGDDLLDLVMRWDSDTDVVIIDAVSSGAPPGTVVRIDGLVEPLPASPGAFSTHAFGLADTVELAQALDRVPRSLTILGVEMDTADHAVGLTPLVEGAIERVVDEVLAFIPDEHSSEAR